jgi:hypothetical protein
VGFRQWVLILGWTLVEKIFYFFKKYIFLWENHKNPLSKPTNPLIIILLLNQKKYDKNMVINS